ncbi:MAG: sugar porter family MFS transporter [Bacteroidales bacterium]|nr:sugar porter family MFS transporter [Bacteroidales bacterium]
MKKSLVLFYALTAAFGALVVGLNMGGISGAIDLISTEFSLSALSKGFVTGALMIGCLFGALFGGRLCDRFGRKPMLLVSAAILCISSLGCSILSHSAAALTAYRFIGGLGVGILSAVIPTYITEISPAKLRGTFVSFYQMGVVIGILIAYCANLFFAKSPLDWHLMLGLPLAFGVIDAVILLPLPESPRWLIQMGYTQRAEKAIVKYNFSPEDAEEIRASGNERKEEKAAFSELFKGKMGKVVFLGSMLAFFQQITGINVVVNYAPSILNNLGIAGSDPLLQTVFIGIANLVFTVIAIYLVDKFPRKTLLVTGCIGCFVCLAYLAYAYSVANPSSIGVLAAILGFIAFFALSLSPLMFVVTSEMYPSRIRGTAMSLSTGISWACAFIVVQFYPWVESTLGTGAAFGIFAALILAAGIFIQFCIPETKDKSLEEIESELKLR